MKNTTPNFKLRDFIVSLTKTHDTSAESTVPDVLVELSRLVVPLREITKEGRALDSTEEYAVGNLIGDVLNAYISTEPTDQQKDECIAGLSILIAILLRTIPYSWADTTIEEFLIDATSQDELIKLSRQFNAAPATIDNNGEILTDFAQFSIFHNPIALTQEAIDGFIQRRIVTPLEEAPSDEQINEMMKSARIVKLSDFETNGRELIADPLNGFDQFYDVYFKSLNGDTDDEQ